MSYRPGARGVQRGHKPDPGGDNGQARIDEPHGRHLHADGVRRVLIEFDRHGWDLRLCSANCNSPIMICTTYWLEGRY
jgi:hypothetical protein